MIGVFLTGQNTAATIGVAVASIASQNRRPDRVAVVDDGSTDGTAAVAMEGLRAAGFSPKLITLKRGKKAPRVCWPSKRAGFEWLASEGCQYGVAIDTDGDYVPPHYLDRLAIALNGSPNAAMAYPRLVQFGARSGTYQPADTKALDRTNIAPATSMVRLSALQQIGGWAEPYPTYAFCDWATWRRMAAIGWSFTPADTEYFWRRHATSVSFTSPLHQEQWAQTIDWTDLVTIAVPISGREWCLGRLLGSLEKQTVPQSVCRIILLDNSGSAKVASTLRDWLSHQQYRSAQYVAEPAVAIVGRSNAGTADTASDGRDGTEGTIWEQDSRPVLSGGEDIPAMETHPMTPENREAKFWRIKPSDILGLLLFLSFWPLVFIDPMLGLGYITGVGCGLLLALYVTIEKWHDGKSE